MLLLAVATKEVVLGKPALGGPWSLVDTEGKPCSNKDFEGEWLLLYFGFTYCPDICPNELVKMGEVISMCEDENCMVRPVFVSLDPSRDTIGQIKSYLKGQHCALALLYAYPQSPLNLPRRFSPTIYWADRDTRAGSSCMQGISCILQQS